MSAAPTLAQSLWDRYRETGESAARAELLEQHLGLVRKLARDIAQRVPPDVELDDLVSAGTLGLVLALESFDPARGLEFSTFATPRIRGAILDELRAQDWVPRSVRRRSRAISGAVKGLEHRLARSPRPQEIAEELGIGLDTYWQWQHDVERATLVRNPTGYYDDPVGLPGANALEGAATAPAGDVEIERRDDKATLRDLIGDLPPRERTVLSLYYYEELNLRQIAEVLHLTESRISQIRTGALRRLRERLGAHQSLP